jgi:hypothetical protein
MKTPRSLDCLSPRSRVFLYLCLAAVLLLLSYQLILDHEVINLDGWSISGILVADNDDRFVPDPIPEKELVFAALAASNMSWVEEHLPEWRANIYRADAKDGLTVPVNKGNEAMVYLTYVSSFSELFYTPTSDTWITINTHTPQIHN